MLPKYININNARPIPIHSIHNTVQEFKCQNYLRHYEQFYIEETVINSYNLQIKMEASFYSNSLVSYLVECLHVPLSQTKYKIMSKEALKPDTFKEFVLCL